MAEIVDEYIRKNALIDFLVDMSTLEMYADCEEGIRLCIRWIKSIPPVHARYVPDTDVGEFAKDTNVPCKYDPDEFFDRKRPTNADRIRAMSDEELTEYFISDCPPKKPCLSVPYHVDCHVCWLEWLQQEVDNGESN